MSDYPSLVWPTIFLDGFQYRGIVPDSTSIPAHWSIISGAFTTNSEQYLEVSQAGEMKYDGTSLAALRHTVSSNANYGIVFRFIGKDNLKFEIRGRRSDDAYVAFGADFANNQLYMNGSGTTNLSNTSVSHSLFDDVLYSLELWMLDNDVYGIINDSVVMQRTYAENKTNHGFSLYVHSLPANSPAVFFSSAIHELNPVHEPSLDEFDLLVKFRTLIKRELEDPSDRSWRKYVKARQHWEMNRNLLYLNDVWGELGYSIKNPMTEDWFITNS